MVQSKRAQPQKAVGPKVAEISFCNVRCSLTKAKCLKHHNKENERFSNINKASRLTKGQTSTERREQSRDNDFPSAVGRKYLHGKCRTTIPSLFT
jgi:hypothetical protein